MFHWDIRMNIYWDHQRHLAYKYETLDIQPLDHHSSLHLLDHHIQNWFQAPEKLISNQNYQKVFQVHNIKACLFKRGTVFWFQSWSDIMWENYVLVIENREKLFSQEFAKNLRSQNQFRSVQFLKHDAFLSCSWRFLGANTLEKLEFNLEKIF